MLRVEMVTPESDLMRYAAWQSFYRRLVDEALQQIATEKELKGESSSSN